MASKNRRVCLYFCEGFLQKIDEVASEKNFTRNDYLKDLIYPQVYSELQKKEDKASKKNP